MHWDLKGCSFEQQEAICFSIRHLLKNRFWIQRLERWFDVIFSFIFSFPLSIFLNFITIFSQSSNQYILPIKFIYIFYFLDHFFHMIHQPSCFYIVCHIYLIFTHFENTQPNYFLPNKLIGCFMQVKKTVFVVFFSGEQARSKIIKICNAFGANCYPVPEEPIYRRKTIQEV